MDCCVTDLAEGLDDVKLRERHIVVVEGGEKEDVLAPDLVLGREAACRTRRRVRMRWEEEKKKKEEDRVGGGSGGKKGKREEGGGR